MTFRTPAAQLKQVGIREGFRSGLEDKVGEQLKSLGIDPQYETHKIKYTVPERLATYTPDFLLPNGIFIETKGRFTSDDRKKHQLIQKQQPELDIRFVFSNANARISKTSLTTYAAWCEKNGFKYASKLIPESWIKE